MTNPNWLSISINHKLVSKQSKRPFRVQAWHQISRDERPFCMNCLSYLPLMWILAQLASAKNCFVSFWQYFPHSSDCFPHSFSSQEFGKTSLWNKYHSLLCDFWKFVGKTHHSCKFLGHSRPNGLSWPKNLHSLWVFSSLIFPESRDSEMIKIFCHRIKS